MTWCLIISGVFLLLFVLCILVVIRQPQIGHENPGDSPRTVTVSTVSSVAGRSDSIVARLKLNSTQRELILDRYECVFCDQSIRPDIKLEAFVEMIRNARSTESLPVFFAQKRIVSAFAVANDLLWLHHMLVGPEASQFWRPGNEA